MRAIGLIANNMSRVPIKKLELAVAIANHKLNEARAKEILEKVVPQLRQFLGRSYKYHNSYGGSEPARKWWLYKKVIDIECDKEGYLHFIMEEFSVDIYGQCKLEIAEQYPYHQYGRNPFDDYIEIDEIEYQEARADFFKECSLQKKIRAKIKRGD